MEMRRAGRVCGVNGADRGEAMDDPFAIFGLPRRFGVDRGALHRAYLARTAAAHPDVSGHVDDDADEAVAAVLNRARGTLEDPEKRAGVLLELLCAERGVEMAPSDMRALPNGFLLEMMDTREQMEDAARSGDGVQIERWRNWAEDRRSEHHRRVGALFERLERAESGGAAGGGASGAGEDDAAVLRAIRLELNAWRYIERMLEQTGAGGV